MIQSFTIQQNVMSIKFLDHIFTFDNSYGKRSTVYSFNDIDNKNLYDDSWFRGVKFRWPNTISWNTIEILQCRLSYQPLPINSKKKKRMTIEDSQFTYIWREFILGDNCVIFHNPNLANDSWHWNYSSGISNSLRFIGWDHTWVCVVIFFNWIMHWFNSVW